MRPAHALLLAFLTASPTAACERVEVDPAVADRPLPAPGDPVDTALARVGGRIYGRQCAACHRLEGPVVVGPSLAGVVERRGVAWVRGIVLSPDSMLRVDPVARTLLESFDVPMPDTGLDEARFRAVLEYLRAASAQDAGSGASSICSRSSRLQAEYSSRRERVQATR